MALDHAEAQELHEIIGLLAQVVSTSASAATVRSADRALELAAINVADTMENQETGTAYADMTDVLISAARSAAHLRLFFANGGTYEGRILAANGDIVEVLDRDDADGSEARYYATSFIVGAQYL